MQCSAYCIRCMQRKAIEAMESIESIERSRKKAEQEIFAVKLGMLRERCGIKQNEMKNFSQTSVSKLERRKDIKISTLIDYLNSLGMGLEIRAYPKNENSNIGEEVLLRI